MARLRAAADTIGWGLFCSSSWTWCIGMFLPVILLRNWGWPGFWVFAIFNVLGCAGFGYWCSRERSEALCREHAGAMVFFSAVTVAYQMFFVVFVGAFMADRAGLAVGNGPPAEWLAAAAAIVGGLLLSIAPDRWWPTLGTLTTIVSYVTWWFVGLALLGRALPEPTHSPRTLLLAAPIIAFGFLLCPWLDRTFHRARQKAPSVHAFGVFGGTFLPIILMTVAYGSQGQLDPAAPILAHLTAQLLFTIAAHVREIRLAHVPTGARRRQAILLVPVLGGVVLAYLGSLVIPFESMYLLLLGFYGLVFPAYVYLFVPLRFTRTLGAIPWPRSPRTLGLFVLLVVALSPLCAAGFIRLETWLLPIPLAVLWLAGYAGRWMARPAVANPGANSAN
jgi:hypothetical protein